VKRMLKGFLLAGLFVLSFHLQPVEASTIIDPNPTAFFDFSNSFSGPVAVHDTYEFTLTTDAFMDFTFSTLGLGFDANAALFLGPTQVGLTHLKAGLVYDLVVFGESRDFGTMSYTGRATFTSNAAAVPPALLLFASSLLGLGLFAHRKATAI